MYANKIQGNRLLIKRDNNVRKFVFGSIEPQVNENSGQLINFSEMKRSDWMLQVT